MIQVGNYKFHVHNKYHGFGKLPVVVELIHFSNINLLTRVSEEKYLTK